MRALLGVRGRNLIEHPYPRRLSRLPQDLAVWHQEIQMSSTLEDQVVEPLILFFLLVVLEEELMGFELNAVQCPENN
jgi:hypothetical protein